jgi:transcriptional regulator with XRE-family HTH domain
MPRKKRLTPIPITTTDNDIGNRIAERRIALGLTQLQLAEEMGLIQSLVSAYERGVLRLTADMVIRFAKVLNVSTDYILNVETIEKKNDFPLKITSRMAGIQKLPETERRHLFHIIDTYISTGTKKDPQNNEAEVSATTETSENRSTPRNPVTVWSQDEIEILEMYFPNLAKKEILELLPNRTWNDCAQMAEERNIKRLFQETAIHRIKAKKGKRSGPRGPVYAWTDDDREVIKKLYPYAPKKSILTKLKHRTWSAIQKEASRIGIKRIVSDVDF